MAAKVPKPKQQKLDPVASAIVCRAFDQKIAAMRYARMSPEDAIIDQALKDILLAFGPPIGIQIWIAISAGESRLSSADTLQLVEKLRHAADRPAVLRER